MLLFVWAFVLVRLLTVPVLVVPCRALLRLLPILTLLTATPGPNKFSFGRPTKTMAQKVWLKSHLRSSSPANSSSLSSSSSEKSSSDDSSLSHSKWSICQTNVLGTIKTTLCLSQDSTELTLRSQMLRRPRHRCCRPIRSRPDPARRYRPIHHRPRSSLGQSAQPAARPST